jgi:hypothetical protein
LSWSLEICKGAKKLLPLKRGLLYYLKIFGNLIPHISVVLCSGADFHVGKKLQFPAYRDSLKERGTIQMLTYQEK